VWRIYVSFVRVIILFREGTRPKAPKNTPPSYIYSSGHTLFSNFTKKSNIYIGKILKSATPKIFFNIFCDLQSGRLMVYLWYYSIQINKFYKMSLVEKLRGMINGQAPNDASCTFVHLPAIIG